MKIYETTKGQYKVEFIDLEDAGLFNDICMVRVSKDGEQTEEHFIGLNHNGEIYFE